MESKYIEDIFNDYLATEKTNYAILINGSWGSGKTFFWKSSLTRICIRNQMKPIYLSLNGINKIETLDYQLKIKLIPYLNKLDVKKAGALTKISKNILNKVIEKYGNFNPEDILKDIEIDLTLFSRNVICLDDLERCKIPISEVLGYINDFVEHKDLKVILLSDESKINTGDDKNYNAIKEKIIGRILNFNNSLVDILPLLFDKYKINTPTHFAFLESKKEYIYDLLIEYKEENLRNITFYFDTLSKVYPVVKPHNDFSDEVILSTLIITIEFKTGKLNSNDNNDFKGYENLNSPFALFNFSRPKKDNSYLKSGKEGEIPKTDLEIFHDKYLSNNISKYFFYISIYKFILTGYFDRELLESELLLRHPIDQPAETRAFRKLLNSNFREINNDEFKQLCKDVIKYASEGAYAIYDYLHISKFYVYFSENKLINLSIEEIQEELKKGIEISKKRKESDVKTYRNIFHFIKPEDNNIIAELIKEAHDSIEMEKESIKTNKLIDSIKENNIETVDSLFKEYKHQLG